MSYVYSNGLCEEALRIMKSKDSLESRLVRSFSEMGVAKYRDTSDEIWKKWLVLKQRYYVVSGEIQKLKKEGVVIQDDPDELKKFGQDLIDLIGEWKKFNNSQIKQGKLNHG
ncbi:MAG: hypothetical protein HYU70_07130 [Bacteroidetes bacterium]|nr:hypothetical protein [Bacteroidota bacterium]